MHLNYLPLRFTAPTFRGGEITIEGESYELAGRDSPLSTKLRQLRQEHDSTHVFHASGNTIACVPLSLEAGQIGEPKTFNTLADFQLANAVARAALFRFFKSSGNEVVIGFRPVTLLLEKRNLARDRKDIFGIYPEYTLDVRPLAPHEGDISSGVLMGFGIRYVFLKTIEEMVAERIPVDGLYAVRLHDEHDVPNIYERRYLGKIESVRGSVVALSDSDVEEFAASQCYLEGSRTNLESVGRHLLKNGYDGFSRDLHEQTFDVMGAEQQVQRLNQIGEWLARKSPLDCAAGLGLIIHKSPHDCPDGTDAGTAHSFNTPKCVLRPGGSITVSWPVDKQIDLHGPYDAESFPDKRARVAVVCPSEFIGDAGTFFRQMQDGLSSPESNPFRKGFVRKYHLNSCDFTFHEVKRNGMSLEDAYKAAAMEALKNKPHLAVAVIREQHRKLPDAVNPYYLTKALMMGQGVPVQLVKIETIRQDRIGYILNNISLAIYAKLGGIPWTLAPQYRSRARNRGGHRQRPD